MPSITVATKASVYVLARHRQGRPTIPVNKTATWRLLEDEYFDLPDHVQAKFDALVAQEDAHIVAKYDWAKAFIKALDEEKEWLPRLKAGAIIRRDADWSEMTTREIALARLWETESQGTTLTEMHKHTGVTSGGLSGALSELVAAGVAVRLEQQR